MNNGLDAYPSRCLNAMLTLLYFAVMLIGVSIGILVVRPFVQVKVSYDRLETLGTWRMKLDGNTLVTGATFDMHVSFYNPAIFPLTFSPRNVTFYHYPIGSHLECIKCNYADDYVDNKVVDGKISLLHKPVLLDTTDGLISLKDLTITVPPKSGRFGPFKVKVPVKAYFTVEKTASNSLGEVKPLYLDCKKHNRLLLSIRITDVFTRFWLITRQVPSVYEILVPLECQAESGVDAIFEGANSTFTGSILGSSPNIVDKDVNQMAAA